MGKEKHSDGRGKGEGNRVRAKSIEGNPMHKKITRRAFCSMLLALPFPAQAQQQARVFKIGWLTTNPRASSTAREQIARELRALGYVEGKNFTFEYRSAEGKLDRLPALADELVRLKVDLIVVSTTPGALALKNATRTIPIVFLT